MIENDAHELRKVANESLIKLSEKQLFTIKTNMYTRATQGYYNLIVEKAELNQVIYDYLRTNGFVLQPIINNIDLIEIKW